MTHPSKPTGALPARRPSPRTALEVGRLRVANQRIVASTFAAPADAVRFLLAMQGQDYASVKWSIGLRVPNSTDADVEAAFASRAIVRSWPLRGTLHVTAAEDLPWMLELLAPRVVDGARARRAALDLDARTLSRARDIALSRLSSGAALTREELLAAFDAGGVATTGQRGYHLLFHLSVTGTLCFGPAKGKEQTFVLLDTWIRAPRRLDRDEAKGELARRFFEGHGPATLADLVGWAKLTAGDAKIALALARPELAQITVDGVPHFLAASAEARLEGARAHVEGSVAALPGFDEYVLGYKDRATVLARADFARVVPGGNGVFRPTIVVDGQVRGTWRRTPRKGELLVEPLPFTKLHPKELRAFGDAIGSYARFLGASARVA